MARRASDSLYKIPRICLQLSSGLHHNICSLDLDQTWSALPVLINQMQICCILTIVCYTFEKVSLSIISLLFIRIQIDIVMPPLILSTTALMTRSTRVPCLQSQTSLLYMNALLPRSFSPWKSSNTIVRTRRTRLDRPFKSVTFWSNLIAWYYNASTYPIIYDYQQLLAWWVQEPDWQTRRRIWLRSIVAMGWLVPLSWIRSTSFLNAYPVFHQFASTYIDDHLSANLVIRIRAYQVGEQAQPASISETASIGKNFIFSRLQVCSTWPTSVYWSGWPYLYLIDSYKHTWKWSFANHKCGQQSSCWDFFVSRIWYNHRHSPDYA